MAVLSDGQGFPDQYYVDHGAPAPTATVPPTPEGASLRIVQAPTFGTFSKIKLQERQDEPIGEKSLPMRWATALTSPTLAAGLRDGVARISVFDNPRLLGLRMFGGGQAGFHRDYGATSAHSQYGNQPNAADVRKPGLLRRSMPWVRSPKVTSWPVVQMVFPRFGEDN